MGVPPLTNSTAKTSFGEGLVTIHPFASKEKKQNAATDYLVKIAKGLLLPHPNYTKHRAVSLQQLSFLYTQRNGRR